MKAICLPRKTVVWERGPAEGVRQRGLGQKLWPILVRTVWGQSVLGLNVQGLV